MKTYNANQSGRIYPENYLNKYYPTNQYWVVPKGTVVCPFTEIRCNNGDNANLYLNNETTIIDWIFTIDDMIDIDDEKYYFIKITKTENNIIGFAVVKGYTHPL